MTHGKTIRIALYAAGLAVIAACAPKKQTYTIPQVTTDIESAVRKVRDLKNAGKLEQASRTLSAILRSVLNDFPETTITQEPVKQLIATLDWMANLCLDRSLELKNEAVSAAEDKLSRQFRQWSDEHRDNLVKLRKLLPSLKSSQVAPRPGPAGPGGEPRRKGAPQPTDGVTPMDPGMEPTPSPEPGMEPEARGAEPGAEPGMEPESAKPGMRPAGMRPAARRR